MTRTIDNLPGVVARGTSTQTLTLAEQIADRIADAIIAGRYSPGDRLSEQEIADLFSVSRGPVRDAFRLLEIEDLVRILPRRGTVVTRLAPHEVQDIFSVRASLMGLAARLTTERLTAEMQSWIKASVSQIRAAAKRDDVDPFLRLAYQLSMSLVECSHNEKLKRVIQSMARQTLPLTRTAWTKRENRVAWADNWCRVATAILERDPAAAETAACHLVRENGTWAVAIAASTSESAEKRA